MTDCVLDASAVIAFIRKEPGADVVRPCLREGYLSAVNAGEVMNCLHRSGKALEDIVRALRDFELRIVDFGFSQAAIAASLEPYARTPNLSFGDRACLSLGMMRYDAV